MGSPGRRTATATKPTTTQLTAVRDGDENVIADNESGNVSEHLSKMASKIQAARDRRVEDAAKGGLINRKSHDFSLVKNRANTSMFKTSMGPKPTLNEQHSPSKKSFNFIEKKGRIADHLYYGVGIQSRKASAHRTAKKENKSIDGLASTKKKIITNATNTIIYDSALDQISAVNSTHNASFLNLSNKSPKRILKTRNE